MPNIPLTLALHLGILFAFFVRAFGAGREIARGSFGWAGIAVTLLFGLGHGLFVVDSAVVAQWRAIAITGTLGAGLFWICTRTGSLVPPVVTHNLLNVGYSFF